MADEEYEDENFENGKDDIQPSLMRRIISVRFFENLLKELFRLLVFALVAFVVVLLVNRRDASTSPLQSTARIGDTNAAGLIITRPLGVEWTMDEMIINTSDEVDNHFVRAVVVISCEINNVTLVAELEQRSGEVHAALREIIGSKSYLDIKRVDQQAILTQEIKTRVQRIVGQPGIIDVFLREFSVH